ncbi:ATP-binding cassette domain-containing protein [Streptomyces iconiensis]|uniref:ATP-binding cassette domain-containing protein n=1 Tax=Streptomyces iconiensis TaxID=1384038 RepID=A0ABT7A218_9ACTN|nr:ATP-binding cassette domain-containing protein [Streptomyces iconiensis]MDJ1135346.1 ATP-binding cassette domain-containing protein [Streptomyces iconiensis]
MTESRDTGAAVSADGFGLKGPRGRVFSGVSFSADAGALLAVAGPSGSGRTCLLLALTGRMKATEGHAKIAGHPLPKRLAAVRRISALGPVPGVNDLDPALTVTEQLRERVLLQRRFGSSLRSLLRPRRERAAASRARLEAALDAAGLDLDTLPRGGRTSVRDLGRLEELRLSVALAMLGRPRLLAVDDLDLKLSESERAEAWAMARSLADSGTTVLAVCSEPPGEDVGAVVVRTDTEPADAAGTAGSGGADGSAPAGDDTTEDDEKGEAADALAEASRA